MMKRLSTVAVALALLGGSAMAQSATRIRGTVVSLDGTALRLTDAAGTAV